MNEHRVHELGLLALPRLIHVCNLIGVADELRAPVLLVGSALRHPEPRDWDLRVHLSMPAFRKRFGLPAWRWLAEGVSGDWSAERWAWAKACREWSGRIAVSAVLNVDFQIYAEGTLPDSAVGPSVRIACPATGGRPARIAAERDALVRWARAANKEMRDPITMAAVHGFDYPFTESRAAWEELPEAIRRRIDGEA